MAYTCELNRRTCGHRHRTIEVAARCALRLRTFRVVRIDGVSLSAAEVHAWAVAAERLKPALLKGWNHGQGTTQHDPDT